MASVGTFPMAPNVTSLWSVTWAALCDWSTATTRVRGSEAGKCTTGLQATPFRTEPTDFERFSDNAALYKHLHKIFQDSYRALDGYLGLLRLGESKGGEESNGKLPHYAVCLEKQGPRFLFPYARVEYGTTFTFTLHGIRKNASGSDESEEQDLVKMRLERTLLEEFQQNP
ncbi:hypothetical protein ElyMa_006571700 [Elysia marginata]|uniref:Uncharacterized protein n=1 Tax=Elysia marginata TaxID=1093978 RepID=A0AAV4IAS3_9GAST|nr:hypothetical protein ElyMa_006571700 [Elysia marginata]